MRLPKRLLMMSLVTVILGSSAAFLKQDFVPQRPDGWDPAWELFHEGKTLAVDDPRRAETFEGACAMYETIAEDAEGPWRSEALMMAGLCRMWLDDPEAAALYYEQSLAERPDHWGTAAHIYLADAYLELGRTADAQAQAQALLDSAQSARVPEWQVSSARRILGQGDQGAPKPAQYDAAWELFEEAKDLPGASQEQRVAFEQSQALYEQIARENDGVWAADALMMAGLCRSWLRDPEGAASFYEEALTEYPGVNGTAIHYYLAEAYLELGRVDDAQRQAQRLLDRAAKLRVPPWQIESAHRILDRPPDPEIIRLKHDAWDAFTKGKALRDAEARAALMRQAEAAYLEYAKTESGQGRAKTLMMAGVCRSWMADPKGAITYYRKALESAAPTTRADLLAYMVMCYEEFGDWDALRATARQLQELSETQRLTDWQAESASLATASDDLLARRRAIGAEMRRMLDNTALPEEAWHSEWGKLKDRLSELVPE